VLYLFVEELCLLLVWLHRRVTRRSV